MPSTLAKANTGVNQQVLSGNPSRLGRLETPMQKGEYFVDKCFIARLKLHGPGHALHVHQDQRHMALCHYSQEGWIESQGANIVDQVSARVQGCPRDSCAIGI